MKVRLDFVTNSSSSSFLYMTANSSVLADIIIRYSISGFDVNGSKVSYSSSHGEAPMTGTPNTEGGMFSSWLIAFLEAIVDMYGVDTDEEEGIMAIEALQEANSKTILIDGSLESYSFESIYCSTDGGTSSWTSESMSGEGIIINSINENEWSLADLSVLNDPELGPDQISNGEQKMLWEFLNEYDISSVIEVMENLNKTIRKEIPQEYIEAAATYKASLLAANMTGKVEMAEEDL